MRLLCPVDEFNAARHVGDESPALVPPPSPERLEQFFTFLKDRIATARKYAPAARDYALLRTLYHAGLRADEASHPQLGDVYFDRGPQGKLHVHFGKAAHTSIPRPRWVPMLDGLDLVLRWYLNDVRNRFPASDVLFADESGGALARGTICNRRRYLMTLQGKPAQEWFSPHALRRACATHNYERGIDLLLLATRGDFQLTTRGDFLMAMDTVEDTRIRDHLAGAVASDPTTRAVHHPLGTTRNRLLQ